MSRAPRAALSLVGLVGLIAVACGGKVDVSDGTGVATTTPGGGTPGGGRHPGGGTRPSRTVSATVFASDVAEGYCKTFSSCCVGAGQPPIDVSRCRTLITAAVMGAVGADAASAAYDVDSEAVCVEVIRDRTAACGKTDVAWAMTSGGPALFAPSSVQLACNPLIGARGAPQPQPQPCDVTSGGCAKSAVCAVDECSSDPGPGASCGASPPCLDGLTCASGTCAAPSLSKVGGSCMSDTDCALGLVCASGTQLCAPAREFAGQYKERSSPYRVGADTCAAFSSL